MTWLDFNPYNSKNEKEAHLGNVKRDIKNSLALTGLGLFDVLGGAYMLAAKVAHTNGEAGAIVLASALGALWSLAGGYSAYEGYQISKAIKKTPVQKASEKTIDDKVDSKESTCA
ncbi:MAG: hypothetical protein NTY99_01385 [DPANN group archaeon]|nr:hypothetical protein [DPANN group archaeon]